MTRTAPPAAERWALQDAKARFSELIRRAQQQGPQHVTIHGNDVAVVVTAEEYQRLLGHRTGRDLIAALQSAPHPDMEFDLQPTRAPIRTVNL